MSTWHQDRNPMPLWHPTQWTLVIDPPNQMRSVERFDTAEAANFAAKLRGGYVIPPSNPPHERPLAAAGLTSYRCKGRYGWIMIGARDDGDAMREARRSCSDAKLEDLEVWNGSGYAPVKVQEEFADVLKRAIARSGQ
ncbi:hypothetical protein [Burkholderia vietnamiensis]|uniref:hypothetical protein n=1 Tax=Burkholderia vietnamiensis TaxID=60552 RepID=UPI001CB612BD|nr:hypothetical protein [Burkholderia vietnamiensis]CAG9228576.1 hypothetical protein BVI1335_70060 [Burkholderia vietnamiensis]HDR9086398.1 hypothetical protein [Burkholderia vietnamiensis]